MTDGRHALAEERSLVLNRAVAERLRANPALINRARRRTRWSILRRARESDGRP